MGCSPSRVQPNAAAATSGDSVSPEPQPSAELVTFTASVADSPLPASVVESYSPPSQSSSDAVLRPQHISIPSTSVQPFNEPSHTSASPRSQQTPTSQFSQPLFNPPSSSSLPRQSILKQPGKKKDFDAIRAMKNLSSPHSHSHTTKPSKRAESDDPHPHPHDDDGRETKEQPAVLEAIIDDAPSADHTPRAKPEEKEPSPSPTHAGAVPTSRQNSFKTGKKGKRRTSHQGLMSKLALQFPAIRESFSAVYSSFKAFCESDAAPGEEEGGRKRSVAGRERITVEQFAPLLAHLTHHSQSFSEQQVRELFAISHITHAATLTFREVLIAIALGYYLAPPPSSATPDPTWSSVGHGFRLVERAFKDIDDDGSGMLSASEMKQALFATSGVKGRSDERDLGVLDLRFKELDINGDGDVEFQEFLYGVVSWVGMSSEDDVDDGAEQTERAA